MSFPFLYNSCPTKMLFHFHKTTIIRSIPGNSHTEPETEPSQAQDKDKHAVFISCRLKMEGCRLHRQLLLLFDFYFVVIMSNFRTETSEESCRCEISINLYFCTCLFNFFLILQTLMFIYLKFTPTEKKTAWREYSGQRVRSWSVFYWRGFKSHAYLSFFFHSSCDIKKIITFYPIVNLTTSNFDFIFHKLAKFTNFYSHSSSLKVISEIMGLIHWMCNLGAAHLHVYQPCLIFPLFLHYQSSFSLNVL